MKSAEVVLPTPRLTRIRATHDDLEEVLALLHERSAWLKARRIDQWNPPYPVERLERDIAAGYVWCWREADRVIATVTLTTRRPDYYPEHIWVGEPPAWYLCRLAVAPQVGGRALGASFLASIEADAAQEGVRALRLDVKASNPFLLRYYAALGYGDAGRGEILGEPAIFLEKRLT